MVKTITAKATAAANTAVNVNVAGVSNTAIYVHALLITFSGGTPASTLTVSDGGTAIIDADLSDPTFIFTPNEPIKITAGNSLDVDVTTPGAGVTTKVNVIYSKGE